MQDRKKGLGTSEFGGAYRFLKYDKKELYLWKKSSGFPLESIFDLFKFQIIKLCPATTVLEGLETSTVEVICVHLQVRL